MAEYLLKVSFVMAIALLFYKLVLQQESFFATNRIYFLCSMTIAFSLPFVQIPQLANHQGLVSNLFQGQASFPLEQSTWTEFESTTPELKEGSTNEASTSTVEIIGQKEEPVVSVKSEKTSSHVSNLNWQFCLLILYLFGVAIFTLNLLFQIGSLYYKIFTSRDKIQEAKYVIVNTQERQAPCSFFKYIFIYADDYDFTTYEQIIAHEKIHVQQGHSWDLLFAELAVVVLWFNPLIWLYKSAVERNIEFQTDALLLKKESIDKSQYQLSLLQIAIPHKPLAITTNYNQSLLKQRIMMMNAKKSTMNRYWKYAFTAPLFLGALLLLNEPATSQKNAIILTGPTGVPQSQPGPLAATDAMPFPVPNPTASPEPIVLPEPALADEIDMTDGFFYSYERENQYCIDFKGKNNNGNWHMSDCFDKTLFQKQSEDVFTMTRETGTLKLIGTLDKEVGQGKYVFTKDASFEKYLADQNLKVSNDNHIFQMHLHNVDRKYIDFLKGEFNNINVNHVLAMAIHEVNEEYIDNLGKAGFDNLSPDKILAAKIHDINPSTIKELQSLGFDNLDLDKMIALNIHGVNAAYLSALKSAGFSDVSVDEAISAKIHDLSPKTIQEIKALGFSDLNLRRMTELQIHEINAQFVEDLKAAGFDNLSLDEVIQARIHDLSPTAIKEIKALDFGDLSLRKMIELQIHEINAEYIERLKSAGFTALTLDQIVQAKIHDLEAADVEDMRALGFNNLSFEKLLQAKIHDVNAAYLSDLRSAGFSGISIDKAIESKIHGVDSEFIKEAKSKGYNLKTLDEYIRVKMHGLARNGSE